MKTTILLFTRSFPYYSLENSFLQHEVKYLEKNFSKLIILPSSQSNDQQIIDSNIIVDSSFALFMENYKRVKTQYFFKSFFSLILFKELISQPKVLIRLYRFRRLINSISYILYIRKWLSNYINQKIKYSERLILYTYWFTNLTFALSISIKNKKNIHLITRTHGADLYEARNKGYIPLRKQSLGSIDKVFFASDHALNYAKLKYPNSSNKFKLAKLGTKDSCSTSDHSTANDFKIVSCSSIIKIKRVDLIYHGICEFSNLNIDKKITWTHFGDGDLEIGLLKLIEKNKPKNLVCNLKGYLRNSEILNFYKNNLIDIFISTSASEGGRPVSIQEALSFGIPIIATPVGGIPEIVNNKNGVLLKTNPADTEIANALQWFIKNPKEALKKRKYARLSWEQNCNADINFDAFASGLKKLIFN